MSTVPPLRRWSVHRHTVRSALLTPAASKDVRSLRAQWTAERTNISSPTHSCRKMYKTPTFAQKTPNDWAIMIQLVRINRPADCIQWWCCREFTSANRYENVSDVPAESCRTESARMPKFCKEILRITAAWRPCLARCLKPQNTYSIKSELLLKG